MRFFRVKLNLEFWGKAGAEFYRGLRAASIYSPCNSCCGIEPATGGRTTLIGKSWRGGRGGGATWKGSVDFGQEFFDRRCNKLG